MLQWPAQLTVHIIHDPSPSRARIFVRRNDLVAECGKGSGFLDGEKAPGRAIRVTSNPATASCSCSQGRLQKLAPALPVRRWHRERSSRTVDDAPSRVKPVSDANHAVALRFHSTDTRRLRLKWLGEMVTAVMEGPASPPVQSGETPDSPHPKLVVASGIARQVDHKIMMPARNPQRAGITTTDLTKLVAALLTFRCLSRKLPDRG